MMKEPIRVLCVFSTLDRGGAESMCMNLYRHINHSKVQFDFVKHTHAKCLFEDEIRALGGRIFEAPRFRLYNTLSYSNWWARFLKAHPEYQIIHGHFFTISAIYFRVAKKLGRKTVGHIHASAMDSRTREFLVHRIGNYTDIALACSETAGQWAYGEKTFTVLHNAIDIDSFCYNSLIRDEYRKKLGFDADAFVLGTVANFSPVKNPMGLIDIFRSLVKLNTKSKLLWIGEGSQRQLIEERIKAEGLAEKVLLLGTRSDVPELLQAMDAFAFPSFNEGLGIAAIESQAAGLETFCSDTIPKEAKASSLFHYLPLGSPEIWAKEIMKYTNNGGRKNMKEELKQAGYDINETSAWLERMYQSMIT